MSLHHAAKHLASKGRDGDSMLVHMSPGEVKGLQAIAMAHGGSLSINPDTGLAEASFLKKILPMIAGAALTPFIGPMGAALATGGFETIRTGDIGKGLMAGLGAYGGAGLAQGLSSVGGTAAGLESGASAVGSDAATMGTTEGMTRALTADTGVGSSIGINSFDAANIGQTPLDPTKVQNFSTAYQQGAAPSFANMQAGAQNVAANPMTAGKEMYNAMPTGSVPALGATVANAMTPEVPPIPGAPEEEERYKGAPYRYSLSPNFSGYVPRQPQPYYRPTGLGYAAGGDVMMSSGGTYDDEPMGDVGMASGGIAAYAAGGDLKMKTMSLGDGIYKDTDDDTASLGAYDAAKKRMAKINKAANMPKNYEAKMPQVRGLGELAMAQGGSLGGYSDGGRMLKGPGDGMSDSIPATIGRKQPARLADGEFVVPADVVSHLGNGSTDAGAKKLYSMMDKIRTARTGKKKQAPAVKADKYMPA